MDKSSQHLEDVEREIDELQRGFCVRLCCPVKTSHRSLKKSRSKDVPLMRNQSSLNAAENDDDDPVEPNGNDPLRTLDENLQRMQYVNRLIETEIQLQTLVR